jgi:serine protease Do
MRFPTLRPACLLFAGLLLPAGPARALDASSTPAANASLDLARQLNQAFIQVADEVTPVVVVITVTEKSPSDDSASSDDQSGDDLRRFLPRYGPLEGKGSGIIIRKDGYILTNRHVVEDSDKIEVTLKDGRTFKATVRGVDAPSDIAVIKIDATDLPVATFADSSKTRVGEFAIAIGAPYDLDYSVTFGHVSAKDRSNIPLNDPNGSLMTDQEYIQTDANINPGNSGGPLVNIDGQVIGINTLIRGLHTGIGFAIPGNLAREIADRLVAEGHFARAWLGIGIVSLRESPQYRELFSGVADGVVVTGLVDGGPAARSELKVNDVITAIDGKPVATMQQLKDEVREKTIGRPVTLDVFRIADEDPGKLIKVTVKPGLLEEKSDITALDAVEPVEAVPSGKLGIAVKTLNRETAEHYNVELTEGVIVSRVDTDGPAAQNGIKEGDIITSINTQKTASPGQFRKALSTINLQKGVVINVISDGASRYEIVKVGGG